MAERQEKEQIQEHEQPWEQEVVLEHGRTWQYHILADQEDGSSHHGERGDTSQGME